MDAVAPGGPLPKSTLLMLSKHEMSRANEHDQFVVPAGVGIIPPGTTVRLVALYLTINVVLCSSNLSICRLLFKYQPTHLKNSASLVLLKNNLTIIEKLILEGVSGHASFQFPRVLNEEEEEEEKKKRRKGE